MCCTHTHTHTVNDAKVNYLGCEGFIGCWFQKAGECRANGSDLSPTARVWYLVPGLGDAGFVRKVQFHP